MIRSVGEGRGRHPRPGRDDEGAGAEPRVDLYDTTDFGEARYAKSTALRPPAARGAGSVPARRNPATHDRSTATSGRVECLFACAALG
jgi:hypothetical protein